MKHNVLKSAIALLTALNLSIPAEACTGITLHAKDGSIVFARTLEWGSFDIKSRLVIAPRGHEYESHLEEGQTGISWKSRYGVVGIDAVEKDYIIDGMNEKGLSVNLFYHPGFADHPEADPNDLSHSISPLDVPKFLLTTCESTAEVRDAMSKLRVVSVVEPAIGISPPTHIMVTEPSGKAVVIEYVGKGLQIHGAPLGVITNSPSYDWHITNLRNYLNLSAVALPAKKIDEMDFAPLGGGSGMIGLPGDFTPPSRFVRAVAFSRSARPTDTGAEAMYEAFRILDSFNVPLGAAEGEGAAATKGMRSATIWTSAYDTKNLVMHYHTMHNRRVRQVNLRRIDFSTLTEVIRQPLDQKKEQDIQDVTPLP